MAVKDTNKVLKETVDKPDSEVRYMDKATFQKAKKSVFAKHKELLSKLAK